MKIILSKIKTAIILVLITVLFSGFYAYMLGRPVSYGWKYYDETVYEGVHFEGAMTFDRNGTVQVKNSNFDETLEYYYFHTNGYLFVLDAKTEDERIEEISYIKENFEEAKALPYYGMKINAFLFGYGAETAEIGAIDFVYACKGIVIFAVFVGVLLVAMIVFSCLSVVLSIKAKRKENETTRYKTIIKTGYEDQKNLSFFQILAEAPSFIALLVSAIISNNLIVFIDLFDSFMYLISLSLVVIISRKLSKDLRYEYNYGVGKIEALSSLFCDGVALLGLLFAVGLSVYEIMFPDPTSNLVIAVVGLKVINVGFDVVFFVKQRKITKEHNNAISRANYAEALSSLLFDSVALVSLFVVWLFRNNAFGGYISPVVSIFIAIYLMLGSFKRVKQALRELTDKTLPEAEQMKMLNILTRYYDSYSDFHSINSQKSGDITTIDIHLSFEKNTTFEEIRALKTKMQEEFDSQFGNCIVNIVVGEE